MTRKDSNVNYLLLQCCTVIFSFFIFIGTMHNQSDEESIMSLQRLSFPIMMCPVMVIANSMHCHICWRLSLGLGSRMRNYARSESNRFPARPPDPAWTLEKQAVIDLKVFFNQVKTEWDTREISKNSN